MSNKLYNRETGRIGEEMAADYLQQKGYEILRRNFSTRFGEIDLVCRHKELTVFVEVKTKNGIGFGRPEEMVNRQKLGKIRKMAEIYLNGKEVACRIDVIAIVLQDNGKKEIKHFENVDLI